MLSPKKIKYRRPHRVKYEGLAKGHRQLNFGTYGLQALGGAWVTARQIEAARVAITREMKRGGKLWINIFPHLSISRKPQEVRMGSGKGVPSHWVAVVKTGTVMFEVADVPVAVATAALRLGMHKLPLKARIIIKE